MEYIAIAIVAAIVAAAAGLYLGRTAGQKALGSQRELVEKEAELKRTQAEREAEQILQKANNKANSLLESKRAEAKQYESKQKSQADRERNQLKKKLDDRERSLQQRENSLKQREAGITQKQNTLKSKEREADKVREKFESRSKQLADRQAELELELGELKKKRKELDNKIDQTDAKLAERLEKIAGLTAEEAKQQLIDTMTKRAEGEALALSKDIIDEAKMTANKEAQKVIIKSIQRVAAEVSIENSVSVFQLDSDDVKGQIIGREGRNIRALEAATGVEIIVDDTPEAVVISGYDPLRREVARLSLKRLVADGRIHPARIEDVVAKTAKQLDQQVVEIGERTVIEMNIHGLHPQMIRLVGKMRFRSSYGQNLLQHSRETANLCAIMAGELGLNVKQAKRAGLLHDIGKVSEDDPELSHALLGMKLAERYNEKPAVCNAIGAHHDEVEMKYLISPIVQACDAISGSRPGARREILESYMKRIRELEELAAGYDGVDKAYAIQAGRELRVLVSSDQVDDATSDELSFQIASKIEKEMQYPGQIKVTVIREKRAVNYAK